MFIEGFLIEKIGDIYYPKIENAPNDICIKVIKKSKSFDGNEYYGSYCNYYFWGKGHDSPYHPTDPFYSTTEEGAVKEMLNNLKELMNEHNNAPDKFCWEPVYYTIKDNNENHEESNHGLSWTRNSYSHLIMGNGKIISAKQFSSI